MASKQLEDLRELCKQSLWHFARWVEPHRMYGTCHKELMDFWQREEVKGVDNTLVLMPRDHQKSHLAAVRCAWEIYRDPSITIIYVSATAGLAERQLYDIKNILTGDNFRTLSPDMVHQEEGKREMWNTSSIMVDHPYRKEMGVRDPTISTAGLDTNTTGWHCDLMFKDDVVIPENAYTETARKKVEAQCSQLASVLTTGGREVVVGTRYHPKDHYNTLINMVEEVYDLETDEIIDSRKVYSVFQRQVETNGIFLWPREARPEDGKMYGFNRAELTRKKAKYQDRTQFYAQYYNNPNDLENQDMISNSFQYYDRKDIVMKGGKWFYKTRVLNVYAAMDFAFSLKSRADSTAIIVIGIDCDWNIYVLDILRFKTDKQQKYFEKLKQAYFKWEFGRLRAECTVAQVVIVNALRDMANAEEGMFLKIFDYRPHRGEGSKEERIKAALHHRYENRQVYHYRGGECTLLEEELTLDNPPHDDISDVFASCLSSDYVKAPMKRRDKDSNVVNVQFHSRFGGMV